MMKRFGGVWRVLLTISVVSPLLFSACGGTIAATTDDATITARVKTALVNDPSVDVARIDVSTVKGVVTLSGRVKTKEDEAKAMGLARTVKGVSDVKSTLQIAPSSQPPASSF